MSCHSIDQRTHLRAPESLILVGNDIKAARPALGFGDPTPGPYHQSNAQRHIDKKAQPPGQPTREAAAHDHAALSVGYKNLSQFSREYKRQFAAPPLRNIKNLSTLGQPGSA